MQKLLMSQGQAGKPMSLMSLLGAFKEAQLPQEVRDWVGDELQNYAKVAQTTTRVRDLQRDLQRDLEDCNCATSRWRDGILATACWNSLLEKVFAMVGSPVALYSDTSSDRRACCKHQRAVPTAWLVCLVVQTHLFNVYRLCAAYTVSISCHMLSCARIGFDILVWSSDHGYSQACQVRQRLCHEQRSAKRPGVETAFSRKLSTQQHL